MSALRTSLDIFTLMKRQGSGYDMTICGLCKKTKQLRPASPSMALNKKIAIKLLSLYKEI